MKADIEKDQTEYSIDDHVYEIVDDMIEDDDDCRPPIPLESQNPGLLGTNYDVSDYLHDTVLLGITGETIEDSLTNDEDKDYDVHLPPYDINPIDDEDIDDNIIELSKYFIPRETTKEEPEEKENPETQELEEPEEKPTSFQEAA